MFGDLTDPSGVRGRRKEKRALLRTTTSQLDRSDEGRGLLGPWSNSVLERSRVAGGDVGQQREVKPARDGTNLSRNQCWTASSVAVLYRHTTAGFCSRLTAATLSICGPPIPRPRDPGSKSRRVRRWDDVISLAASEIRDQPAVSRGRQLVQHW